MPEPKKKLDPKADAQRKKMLAAIAKTRKDIAKSKASIAKTDAAVAIMDQAAK